MKNTYYHCFYCNNIPSITLIDDQITISCPENKNHNININIENFCKYCIKQCQNCENCILNNKNKICNICIKSFQSFNNLYQKSRKNNFSNETINNYNTILYSFINEVDSKIKDTKNLLNNIFTKMENELYFYKTLMTYGRKYITQESINNLINLKIFNNIENKTKFFINKMNEMNKIIDEFNNFHNFEFKLRENSFNNDKEKSNLDINNFSQQKQNNNKIENKQNNVVFNNNRKILNNNLNYFKEPEKPLYQINGIKLEDIESRNSYITNKLINITVDIEEEISINERNKFLENVKNIADESDKFSKELCNLLKLEFKKKYHNIHCDNSENSRRALSSWFNQSLIFEEPNENNKRLFFEYKCGIEKNRINKYIQNNSECNKIFLNHNYNYQNLFSDLTQLYSESIFYSEKKIELKRVENCNFINEQMRDITDITGNKFVKYTVLPGLYANNKVIGKDLRILVFCEKYANNNKYQIKGKANYKCNIYYKFEGNNIRIILNIEPKIEGKNIKYSLKFENELTERFEYGKNKTFIIDARYKNKVAIFTIYKNKQILCQNKMKLQEQKEKKVINI